jgi:hypothetical protein
MSLFLGIVCVLAVGMVMGWGLCCLVSAGREVEAYEAGIEQGLRQRPDHWTAAELHRQWDADPSWQRLAQTINQGRDGA